MDGRVPPRRRGRHSRAFISLTAFLIAGLRGVFLVDATTIRCRGTNDQVRRPPETGALAPSIIRRRAWTGRWQRRSADAVGDGRSRPIAVHQSRKSSAARSGVVTLASSQELADVSVQDSLHRAVVPSTWIQSRILAPRRRAWAAAR